MVLHFTKKSPKYMKMQRSAQNANEGPKKLTKRFLYKIHRPSDVVPDYSKSWYLLNCLKIQICFLLTCFNQYS